METKCSPTSPPRQRPHLNPPFVLMLVAMVALMALVSCGSDEATDRSDGRTGIVAVHIEDVGAIFTEGFEVGLRFEAPDGTTIAATLWSDFVNDSNNPNLADYYSSVLEQSVPAGDVVVRASANIGIGPPPEVPDINGDLRCRLEVTVPADGRVDVEVGFGDPNDCLRSIR